MRRWLRSRHGQRCQHEQHDAEGAGIDAHQQRLASFAQLCGRLFQRAGRKTIGLRALNDESLVLLTAEFATREQIDRYCRQNNLRPRVLMEANSLGAVIEIVRRTTLSTLLPAKIASEREGLVAIALAPSRLKRTAVLMQRRGAYQTAAAREFVRLALARGASRPVSTRP